MAMIHSDGYGSINLALLALPASLFPVALSFPCCIVSCSSIFPLFPVYARVSLRPSSKRGGVRSAQVALSCCVVSVAIAARDEGECEYPEHTTTHTQLVACVVRWAYKPTT